MALIKLLAICVLFYAIISGKYYHVLWAMILWEIGGGFKMTTISWFSDFGKGDHDSR